MNKDKRLKQTVNDVCSGTSSAAFISVDKDDDLNITKETPSNYCFVVSGLNSELLDKFKRLGYSIDLEFRGAISQAIHPDFLIRVDVTNKTITRPVIVSVNHFVYLRDIDSILLEDVFKAFDELVINQNKELVNSLRQKSQEAQEY